MDSLPRRYEELRGSYMDLRWCNYGKFAYELKFLTGISNSEDLHSRI